MLRATLRRMIPAVIALLFCAAALTPSDGNATNIHETKPTRRAKVLVIGIDGLRPDALMAADTPSIDALIANGCVTLEASASAHTVSGPGWSTILCGVWPDKHRSIDNRFLVTDYERFPSVFTLAKRARPTIRTAYFGNWGPIGERILANDPIDVRLSLQDPKNDAPQTEACVATLGKDDGIDLAFFYVGNVDEVGHALGFHRAVPGYRAAIEAVDVLVGRVMAAIESRANFDREDWLVILTSDHGGTIDLNHGRDIQEHREVAFIVSGDGAAKGALRATVNQCDVVATAFAHLGITVDRAWDLDSHAVGLARDASAEKLFGRNLVVNGDAEFASPAANIEGNRGVAGWKDWSAVSTLAYGAQKDFPTSETPGPTQRGSNFFFGGDAGESRISQRIDLGAAAADIDAARVPFEFSAWLGGFAKQRDVAWLELRWLDARGGEIARNQLEAVTMEDRAAAFAIEAPTAFLLRRAGGVVPIGARVAEITLRFERSEGVCDGYADEISLVLRPMVAVFDCGPAVFLQSETEATVWMRAGISSATTTDGAQLRCAFESDGGEADASLAEHTVLAVPEADRDGTVRFKFEHLSAGTGYRYTIARVADGAVLARGAFTTWSSETLRTRIAFGSCADIDDSTALVWRQIARQSPDALVLLGDTPYIDSTELSAQRARHRAFASVDSFEALTATIPTIATWDDHDFGRNDTDGRLPGREQSRRAFLEYRPLEHAGQGVDGLFTSFRSGPVEVFLLDARWFAKTEPSRDDPTKPTLLGEMQWKWVEETLRASTAPVKVFASGMVWNSRVRPLKPDYWGAYPHEFMRFQRLIRETKATGVVLVSGDVHRSRVVVHPTKDVVGYDLVEFVTSPLHARVHEDAAVTGPEVVFDAGIPNAFLLLDARETVSASSVTARFVASDGRVFHERTIDLKTLAQP